MDCFLKLNLSITFEELNVLEVIRICFMDFFFINFYSGITLNNSPTLAP